FLSIVFSLCFMLLPLVEDCSVSNDRLLFYTIKPDCSIRIATGALPSAHFKESSLSCIDPSSVRHGTFTRDGKPGILVMFRNSEVNSSLSEGVLPFWIVHLVDVAASDSSAFSMAIGDEDYFLLQKEFVEYEACGLGVERTLICVGASNRKLLRIDRYVQEEQNFSLNSSSSIAVNNGELAGRARIVSVNQSIDGVIRLIGWSNETRKITQITIGAEDKLLTVKKQTLNKGIGTVISINGDTVLTRTCDKQKSRTFMGSLEGKAFRCVHSGSEKLDTVGVISLRPLKYQKRSVPHKILPRSAEVTTEDPPAVPARELPHDTPSELMGKETWGVFETMNVVTQEENEPNPVVAIQTVAVFLYLLVFTVIMFVRTIDDDELDLTFTSDQRAQLHAFDYADEDEKNNGLVERTPPRADPEPVKKVEEAKTSGSAEPVRDSSAPPSESGSFVHHSPSATSHATPVSSATTVTKTPTVAPSESAETITTKPTTDPLPDERSKSSLSVEIAPKRLKQDEHSIESMKEMISPPKETKKKLMETETEGMSPNLTTASRVEPPPLPPPSPPKKIDSGLIQQTYDPRPRRVYPTERIPSRESRFVPPTCSHAIGGGFSTCTALCQQVTTFNRNYAMGLGRSGAPLIADSDSGREDRREQNDND
ncbi:hypothetical protein PFISCL1PPCAC_1681, partial [Pristionchus fissidentatus]